MKFRSPCDGGKPAEKSTCESITSQPDKLVRLGIALMPGQDVGRQNYLRSYLNYYATDNAGLKLYSQLMQGQHAMRICVLR